MRTETRTYEIYPLNELSGEAQEKAHRQWMENFEYPWGKENRDTLKAFEEVFKIEVERWSYDTCTYTYRFTSYYSEEEDNLKGVRLLKYLVNNYWDVLYIPKVNWKHSYDKRRRSRIFVTDCCVLTGYCFDHNILNPIYDFLKSPDNTTLYELMDNCLDSFFKACMDDAEYMISMEAFADECEANEYEFLSDGTLFN